MPLTVKRPTETTVLYTVSNQSTSNSIFPKLARLILLATRLVALLAVLVLLTIEYAEIFHGHTIAARLGSIIGAHCDITLWTNIPWVYRSGAIAGLLYLITKRQHISESLLVIRGLGVQTSTSSSSYLWSSSTRFIPTSSIQDIFIHEAFKGFEVKYYLSIVIEGEQDLVVVFPNILPRRQILEEVWRGARTCLYEPKG